MRHCTHRPKLESKCSPNLGVRALAEPDPWRAHLDLQVEVPSFLFVSQLPGRLQTVPRSWQQPETSPGPGLGPTGISTRSLRNFGHCGRPGLPLGQAGSLASASGSGRSLAGPSQSRRQPGASGRGRQAGPGVGPPRALLVVERASPLSAYPGGLEVRGSGHVRLGLKPATGSERARRARRA